MKVALLTCTKDRHQCIERVVRFVLNQTSPDYVHLIYNNSQEKLRLNENLPKDKFILINSPINFKTHLPYKTLGEIYNDAVKFIPEDCDVVNFMDDDDIFFPNHVEEGIKGMQRGGKTAYKPKFSYFRYLKETSLQNNTLEPSIFVKTEHIKKTPFKETNVDLHHGWLDPLLPHDIFEDPNGPATFVYDWSQEIPTFKTSGNGANPNNFANYAEWSKANNKSDGIITPCSKSWAEHYYKTKV